MENLAIWSDGQGYYLHTTVRGHKAVDFAIVGRFHFSPVEARFARRVGGIADDISYFFKGTHHPRPRFVSQGFLTLLAGATREASHQSAFFQPVDEVFIEGVSVRQWKVHAHGSSPMSAWAGSEPNGRPCKSISSCFWHFFDLRRTFGWGSKSGQSSIGSLASCEDLANRLGGGIELAWEVSTRDRHNIINDAHSGLTQKPAIFFFKLNVVMDIKQEGWAKEFSRNRLQRRSFFSYFASILSPRYVKNNLRFFLLRKNGRKLCLTSSFDFAALLYLFLSIARNLVEHFVFFHFEIRTSMCGLLQQSSVRVRSLSLTQLRIFCEGNPLSLSVALSTQDPNFPKISYPKPKAAGLLWNSDVALSQPSSRLMLFSKAARLRGALFTDWTLVAIARVIIRGEESRIVAGGGSQASTLTTKKQEGVIQVAT